MASPKERARNNVRAGIFVSVAIVAAVATIIVLTDAWRSLTEPKHEYRVTFTVSDGVNKLKEDADVLIGGMLLGKVTKVVPLIDDAGFQRIEVVFEINKKVELYDGAKISIGKALIGDNAWIEIASVGDAKEGTPEGRHFDGTTAPILGGLLGEAGKKLEATMSNAMEITEDFKTKWQDWAGSVDNVMTWASTAPEKIDAVLEEGRGLFADSRKVVRPENLEKIDAFFDGAEATAGNTAQITRRFREETFDKVDHFIDTAQAGLDAATEVVEDVRRDYAVWGPDVRDALAAARLTGQQLKLAAAEIRRSPWKLLYRPQREEFEHELLYEATRSFAMAASDLKAASESARRIVDSGGAELQLDEQTQELMNEMLTEALERYSSAQQRLATVLFSEYQVQ